MTRDMDTLRAIHEAGHAAVAEHVGAIVTTIALTDRGGETNALFPGVSPVDTLAVLLAGDLAVARFLGREPAPQERSPPDTADAQALIRRRGLTAADQHRAREKAAALLATHWPAIERLASRIRSERTVSGDNVRHELQERIPPMSFKIDVPWLLAFHGASDSGKQAALREAGRALFREQHGRDPLPGDAVEARQATDLFIARCDAEKADLDIAVARRDKQPLPPQRLAAGATTLAASIDPKYAPRPFTYEELKTANNHRRLTVGERRQLDKFEDQFWRY